jgi:hypothetical protein
MPGSVALCWRCECTSFNKIVSLRMHIAIVCAPCTPVLASSVKAGICVALHHAGVAMDSFANAGTYGANAKAVPQPQCWPFSSRTSVRAPRLLKGLNIYRILAL